MKLISWNVNGIRACLDKGFLDFFKAEDADVFCLQETKMQKGQAEIDTPGYHQYWNSAVKKGYSGTAVFTKEEPIDVKYGIEGLHDDEGRVITLEFEKYFLVCCYTPNAQEGLKRLGYRCEFEDDMREYLSSLRDKKPVVYCGDLNVAHKEIDLKQTEPRFFRRGEGEVYPFALRGIYRQFQASLPRSGGGLQLVVLQIQGQREECRLAYRLFCRVGRHQK